MKCKTLLLPLLAGLALCAPNTYARNPEVKTPANLASKSLSFTENKGQIINQFQQPRLDIDYRLSAGNGLSVFVSSGQIHYQWAESVKGGHEPLLRMEGHGLGAGSRQEEPDTPAFKMYRMDVTLLGANPEAVVETEGQQVFYERYFQPWVNKSNSNQGVVAHSYQKIIYKNVYPNIDWVLYVKGNNVEYDFVVHPGGKVSDIKMKYGGATTLALKNDGSLLATTPMGKIEEQAPYSFDEQGKLVASNFQLEGNILSFKTSAYNGTLTIDPTLEWGTYFGDLGRDITYGMASDHANRIYICGSTNSISNIATTGSYQTQFGGGGGNNVGDAFLARFDDSGNCLWATYYGGTDIDNGGCVAVRSMDAGVYLAGTTKSSNGIATSSSFQELNGGSYDAFLACFDSTGQRVWSTYYGGSGVDGSSVLNIGVTCDYSHNVLLTGDCSSNSNIATTGSYQSSMNGPNDAFLVKFDSSGQRLWGTYFGGNTNDYGKKIICDSADNIYLTGNTNSTDLASSGAYQSNFGGSSNDAFIAKFNTSGVLQWASYFGGEGIDNPAAISYNGSGEIYIAGATTSITGIATNGSHQVASGGGNDGFLAQFDSTGQLNWASYYGGTGNDVIGSAFASTDGHIYIVGNTQSVSAIATTGSYRDTLNGSYPDAFFAKFNSLGQREWASYYGGSSAETVNAGCIDNAYKIYFGGQTNSASDIASAGTYQPDFGGGSTDGYMVCFNVCETPEQPGAIIGDTVLCSGQAYTFSIDSVAGALSYTWTLPNGWTGSSDSASIRIIPAAGSGSIAVATNNSCATSDSSILNISVNASPEPVIVNTNGTLSTTLPYSSYQWNQDGQAINGATAATYTVTANGNYSVTVTNESGCTASSDTLSLQHVGIEELQNLAKSISIYPNPTMAMVHIQSPVKVAVEVFSLEGRLLRRVENAESFSLKDLAPGMYLMKVYDKAGQLIKVTKIVRQ